jgi:hypothetical protein
MRQIAMKLKQIIHQASLKKLDIGFASFAPLKIVPRLEKILR